MSSPLLQIVSTGVAPPQTGAQAVLFTSANGVREFSKLLTTKAHIPCFCVGDKTSAEAREHGFTAFSAKGGADDLIALVTAVLNPADGPILYLHGKIVTGDITEQLVKKGFTVNDHVIYEQVPQTLTDEARDLFANGSLHILPLFSPMTAKILAAEITAHPDWKLDHIDAICLSENVRKQVSGLEFQSLTTVATPTADAMSSAIAVLLRQ